MNPRRPKTALREFISQVDCNDYEGFVQQFDRSIQTFAKVKSEFELLFNKFALSHFCRKYRRSLRVFRIEKEREEPGRKFTILMQTWPY